MHVRHTYDKDGEAWYEEEECADAGGADRVPAPEDGRWGDEDAFGVACCEDEEGGAGEAAVEGRGEEVFVGSSALRRSAG